MRISVFLESRASFLMARASFASWRLASELWSRCFLSWTSFSAFKARRSEACFSLHESARAARASCSLTCVKMTSG